MCFVCMLCCECVFSRRVCTFPCVCVCLPVSLHKRRLSWQLAALLGNCFAKFRLLLSNIQTPPNHQPAKRPGLCLMPATPSSPLLKLQSPSLLQAPRSVPRLPHSSFFGTAGSGQPTLCKLWLFMALITGKSRLEVCRLKKQQKKRRRQRVLAFPLSGKRSADLHNQSYL